MQNFPTIEAEIGMPWYEGVKDVDYLKIRNDELKEKIRKEEPLNFVDLMIYMYKKREEMREDQHPDAELPNKFLQEAFRLSQSIPNFVNRTDLAIDPTVFDADPRVSWTNVYTSDYGFNLKVIDNVLPLFGENSLSEWNTTQSFEKTSGIINDIKSKTQ